jgi:hydroxyacylglutathione hydrolase
LKDGDTFQVGNIELRALHTPGHTPEHISFVVTDRGGGASEPMGIATGDFVFVGDVGRPDLLETAAGQAGAKEPAARRLFQSLQRFKELPEYLQVWPAHGSGSACGKALGAVPQSTVGYEKRFNAAIADATEERRFVKAVLAGQPEPPLYFARMKRSNRDGPKLLGKLPSPPPLDANELKKLAAANAVILDTRPWPQFRESHIAGALWTPLSNYFPSAAGSYVEPATPFYLVVADNRLKEAVTDLIRIGLDDVAGYVTPETFAQYQAGGGRVEQIGVMPMAELSGDDNGNNAVLLDVRGAAEFEAGHLPNAVNIVYTHLSIRLGELPKDRPILVYCRTDNRSAIATALLKRHGYDVTHLSGGFVASQEPQKAAVK